MYDSDIKRIIAAAVAEAEVNSGWLVSTENYPFKLHSNDESTVLSDRLLNYPPLIPKVTTGVDPNAYSWMLSDRVASNSVAFNIEDEARIAAIAMSSWRILPSSLGKVLEKMVSRQSDLSRSILKMRVDSLLAYGTIQLWALTEILKKLREEKVTALLIKGTAARFQCYDPPVLRASRDLDLAVPRDQLSRTWRAITSSGFSPSVWSSRERRLLPAPDSLKKIRDEADTLFAQRLNISDVALATKLVRVPHISLYLKNAIALGQKYSSFPWVTLPDGGLACYLIVEVLPDAGVGLPEDIDPQLVFDSATSCFSLDCPSSLPSSAITLFQIANKMFRNSHGCIDQNPFLWSNYADMERLIYNFNKEDIDLMNKLYEKNSSSGDVKIIIEKVKEIFPHLCER